MLNSGWIPAFAGMTRRNPCLRHVANQEGTTYKPAQPPTSQGRGTGLAGPQAQRPLGGQRTTRSGERGGNLSPT